MISEAGEARQQALRDITEHCNKWGGMNYLYHEEEVCSYAGILKPDFRAFNGGHNKKK
jgi:hypothetical protein